MCAPSVHVSDFSHSGTHWGNTCNLYYSMLLCNGIKNSPQYRRKGGWIMEWTCITSQRTLKSYVGNVWVEARRPFILSTTDTSSWGWPKHSSPVHVTMLSWWPMNRISPQPYDHETWERKLASIFTGWSGSEKLLWSKILGVGGEVCFVLVKILPTVGELPELAVFLLSSQRQLPPKRQFWLKVEAMNSSQHLRGRHMSCYHWI